MTIVLRLLLVVGSLFTFIGIIKRVRNAKVQIETSLFWVVFSAFLLLISLFPQIVEGATDLLGMYSASNCIFLFIIFILIVHQFLNSIKISQMEQKISSLTQELAVRELDQNDKKV